MPISVNACAAPPLPASTHMNAIIEKIDGPVKDHGYGEESKHVIPADFGDWNGYRRRAT